jgi:hypothetical protein
LVIGTRVSTRHHVGGAEIDQRLRRRQARTVAEAEDAAVFEEAADDGFDADVVGQTRHLRPQAADAAHDKVDLHAGPARFVKLVDHLGVHERVEFHPDLCRPASARVFRLGLDVTEDARA